MENRPALFNVIITDYLPLRTDTDFDTHTSSSLRQECKFVRTDDIISKAAVQCLCNTTTNGVSTTTCVSLRNVL